MRIQKLIVAAATAVGLVGPSAFALPSVFADNGANQMKMESHPVMNQVQGSIQLTPEQLRAAHQAAMNAMNHKLKGFAKISASQADKIAEKAVPGSKIQQTHLQPFGPSRSLVYVVFTQSASEKTIVIIDAGNGAVLDKHVIVPHPQPSQAGPTPA